MPYGAETIASVAFAEPPVDSGMATVVVSETTAPEEAGEADVTKEREGKGAREEEAGEAEATGV